MVRWRGLALFSRNHVFPQSFTTGVSGAARLASAVVVALYLLDRRKKKYIVPTLRFFGACESAPVMKHRRKLQQPWSLLLQLVSLLLLLLAIAQLRMGSRRTFLPRSCTDSR